MTTRTYTYDPLGNITYKSDVGAYSYNPASPTCAVGAGGGPHALRCVVGTVMGIVNPSFSYDANGNLISGLNRTLTYTSFNLPATITAPNNLVPGTPTAYTYGYNAEHERVKHIIQRTDGTFTTIYLHPAGKGALLYEKEIKPTLTEHKHYLSAGGQLIGVYLTRSDGTTEMRYFHSDRLGSVTLITNASGAQIERLAYEAYGKRRNPNGTDDPNNTLYGITTDRGFTAHEHLDEIALIHMNGRIYDPLLARFMTPDPYIQSPANLQSYNRYSYVFNNPLAGTDPTGYLGHFFDPVVDPVVGAGHSVWRSDVGRVAVTVAVAYFTGYYNWGTLANPYIGVFGTAGIGNTLAAGFAGGLVQSGDSLEGGIQGAFSAALFYGAGNLGGGPLLHAGAGCISAVASGGRCGQGALSAGFAEFAGPKLMTNDVAANLIVRAVIGGTASVIGGGKFENGAYTASFGYLFNELQHNGYVLRNPAVRKNLEQLNQAIIDQGYRNEDFVLSVTGGDRYRDPEGNIRSATDDSIVRDASPRSPHLYERGARAVDLSVTGIANEVFDRALRATDFAPGATARNYPNAPHTHINLPNERRFYYVQ